MTDTAKRIGIIVTTASNMRTFYDIEACKFDDVAFKNRTGCTMLTVEEVEVGCKCRVEVRVKIHGTVACRYMVFGHTRFCFKKKFIDRKTCCLIDTDFVTACKRFRDNTTKTVTFYVFRRRECFFGNLSDDRSIVGNCKSVTTFFCIRRAEVEVGHKFIKVEYKEVCREKTINVDLTDTLFDVLTEIVKVLTCFKVMRGSTTEAREVCGFTACDASFHDTTFRYCFLFKCFEDFTGKDLFRKGNFLRIGLVRITDRKRIRNFYICHS